MHKRALALLLGFLTLAPLSPSSAQGSPPNPFLLTCKDLMAATAAGQREIANMLIYWAVGYMHGRLGGIEKLELDGAHHDRSVADMVNALQQICPNVPDLPLSDFAANLAGDVERSVTTP